MVLKFCLFDINLSFIIQFSFQDIADPFFAYCKLHADKASMRAKRRNWLAIQSRVKKHSEREIADDKERVS